jgi:dolichol-phosphate mannosyltransferase
MLRWIKFNAVGISGFAVQMSVLALLTHHPHPLNYLLATACAVELALLNNFFWHQRWTWRDRQAHSQQEMLYRLAKFHVTNGVVSLAGNLLLMHLLVGLLAWPIMISNASSVLACSIVNFVLADRVAFYAS